MPESHRPGDAHVVPRSRRWARVRLVLQDAQWWLIAAAAITAFALGFVGFAEYQSAIGAEATGLWDVTYRSLQLFTLESGALVEGEAVPPSLNAARFLAPLVTAGAVVRAALGLFREQAQLVRLRTMRDHVVVCGVGRKGLALARSLREHGYQVVAVEQDAENDLAVACRSAGVPVLVGDATDVGVLRKAGIQRAGFVVALCGQSGTNAQIATVSHQLSGHRGAALTCLAHVVEPELCSLLRARFPASGDGTPFRLEFFDIYDRASRVLLQRHPPFGASDDAPDEPHLLVVGFGRLGQGVVKQAARNWMTSGRPAPGGRFRITVVDPQVTDEVDDLVAAHPELGSACRIESSAAYDPAADPPVTIAYVCLGDEAQALLTGLTLHASLQDLGARVVVRGRTDEGLPSLLSTAGSGFDGLRGFAVLEQTCDAGLLFGGFNESLAQLLHAHYVGARETQGWTHGAQRDDVRRTHPALTSWPGLRPEYKESNRDQAAHTWAKLAAVHCELVELTDWDAARFTFTDDEVELLAEMEHQRWMDYQRRVAPRGSRSQRAADRDMVPWQQLPEDEREIDRAFVRALPRLLAQLGYQVVRRPSEQERLTARS